MTAANERLPFGVVDRATADLIEAVATDWKTERDRETFTAALRAAAGPDGRLSHNDVRLLMSNEHGLIIEPRRYSALWHWAALSGLVVWVGEYDENDDTRGRNKGKPQRVYRLVNGGAS